MRGQVLSVQNANYAILIRDADGRHLELESFPDLESARRRLAFRDHHRVALGRRKHGRHGPHEGRAGREQNNGRTDRERSSDRDHK